MRMIGYTDCKALPQLDAYHEDSAFRSPNEAIGEI